VFTAESGDFCVSRQRRGGISVKKGLLSVKTGALQQKHKKNKHVLGVFHARTYYLCAINFKKYY
jgi:hypothetical protein